MTLSRRELLTRFGAGDRNRLGALVGARGREAFAASGGVEVAGAPSDGVPIRLDSNENPLGPGRLAIDALTQEFDQVMRYPYNSRRVEADLRARLAAALSTSPDNIVPGAGSSEILRNAVRAFTSPSAHLVTVAPTFALCEEMCRQIGHPVMLVGLDSRLRVDVDAMVAAAQGAGLVFLCNPNNPTSTMHGRDTIADVVARVRKASPSTVVLIDEAYHDYVTSPDHASAVPLALEQPGLLVVRTFSKVYGMAGLRLGYAVGHADTVKALARYRLPNNTNVLAVAAALAALGDPGHVAGERQRNSAVRAFTVDFFTKAGFPPAEAQGNFVFVPIGRPARAFRDACARDGVHIGRDFPPFERTHVRISLGTMDEMRRATGVFAKILSTPATSAARGGR